jgi:hypothetical protein
VLYFVPHINYLYFSYMSRKVWHTEIDLISFVTDKLLTIKCLERNYSKTKSYRSCNSLNYLIKLGWNMKNSIVYQLNWSAFHSFKFACLLELNLSLDNDMFSKWFDSIFTPRLVIYTNAKLIVSSISSVFYQVWMHTVNCRNLKSTSIDQMQGTYSKMYRYTQENNGNHFVKNDTISQCFSKRVVLQKIWISILL